MTEEVRKTENPHIKDHIERCIELYGQPIDVIFNEEVDRSGYEQMRADLMIAVGMLMGLAWPHPNLSNSGAK